MNVVDCFSVVLTRAYKTDRQTGMANVLRRNCLIVSCTHTDYIYRGNVT